MAEISRENIKRILTRNWICFHGEYNCVGVPCSQCAHNVSEKDSMMALHKAISYMEKLDEIEQILIECDGWHDDTCHALERIEQIIKG